MRANDLQSCCGSLKWVEAIAQARPFANWEDLTALADRVWSKLDSEDWLEAFRAHPRIGEKKANARWTADEQSGTRTASNDTMDALAKGNREYEEKFGHIYLVCATGRSADDMLANLRERMKNDRGDRVARRRGRAAKDHRAASRKAGALMAGITTHVLDTAKGRPAAGVRVTLSIFRDDWKQIVGHGVTDADGRLRTLTEGIALEARNVSAHVRNRGVRQPGFFPEISIVFRVEDPGRHYHVPLLLSPFGYSTYRGS